MMMSSDRLQDSRPECFVIMPISDPSEYDEGHFRRVYDLLFAPACRQAGFEPKRADYVAETNLIQLEILRSILNAPMALCDLSSRNPNVLFELGLRQAFDKPVTIVQELRTARIFDIQAIRVLDYHRDLRADHVQNDLNEIATWLEETYKSSKTGRGVNSIVRLLSIDSPANIPNPRDVSEHPFLERILHEIAEVRWEIRRTLDLGHTQIAHDLGQALDEQLELLESESFRLERKRHNGDLTATDRIRLRQLLDSVKDLGASLQRSSLATSEFELQRTQRTTALLAKLDNLLRVASKS